MNRILLTALVAGSLLFSACGNRTKNTEGKKEKGKKEKITRSDKENASALIGYTNNCIDYLNAISDWLRTNDSRIEDMTDMMENKSWTNIMPFLPATTITMNDAKFAQTTEPPAGVMSKEDTQFFKENMTEVRENFTALMKESDDMFKYIRNQDYKDDDYARGQEMADRVIELYNEVSVTKRVVLDKIDELAAEAEKILLADHPLRDPIFALKEDLANFDNLYATLYAYNDGEATVEEMDEAYKTTEASIEKNRAKFAELLSEYSEKSTYDDFYKACGEALDNCRRIMRKAREGRNFDGNDLNTFSNNYNRIISAYNRFNS